MAEIAAIAEHVASLTASTAALRLRSDVPAPAHGENPSPVVALVEEAAAGDAAPTLAEIRTWSRAALGLEHIPAVWRALAHQPRLLAATGTPYEGSALDGMNLLPVLRGAQPAVPRTVYWRFKAGDQAAVRQGDWKYLRVGGKEHLFDVARDPRERAELKARHPEKFAELRQLWEEWNRQMLPYPQDSLSESVKLRYPDRY